MYNLSSKGKLRNVYIKKDKRKKCSAGEILFCSVNYTSSVTPIVT